MPHDRKHDPSAGPPADPPDPGLAATPTALLRDWITVWQSELTALASDREAQENWQAAIGLMAGAMQAIAPIIAGATLQMAQAAHQAGHDNAPRRARAAAPPRPAPAAAAPDAGDGELERLAARVADLERRLAARDRPAARRRKPGA